MGIRERQARDRQATRRAILDAARELFVSQGYANVSLRRIAERIEYSPAAIYSYFPSKDDIFFALADEGFSLLRDISRSAEPTLESLAPLDRLRESLSRIYRFSCEHRQYFALMFVDRTVPRISREYEAFASAQAVKRELLGHVQACIDSGALPAQVKPHVAFRLLTVGLLGIAMMRVSGRLSDAEHPDALARDCLDLTIAGLRAGVDLRSNALPCAVDFTVDSSPVPEPHDTNLTASQSAAIASSSASS
jgi:AcrR family transcriptional regulator